ncbi:MAG: HAM1 protein [Anaerolineales bacterium]|nr:HAM1 protein [Anaerolineales bacterium]
MPPLLIATTNLGKLGELKILLAGRGLELTDLRQVDLDLAVVEDGPDYDSIARRKATLYAAASGLWTIADDTGLEVDALGGAPGVRTARLSEDDASRRAKLLQLLAAHPRPWTARFRCSVALAGPRGEVAIGRGDCEGEILPEERGDHGFGYDPIFLVAGTHYTMAELPLIEKNRLSHRARAVRALLPELRARLTSPD